MGLPDIGWQGIGVIATAALGIYNAIRAYLDRRWVREEPTRAAQREIRTELRERYQAILDEVKSIDSATAHGKCIPADTPHLDTAFQILGRLAQRLTPENVSDSVRLDGAMLALFKGPIFDVQLAQSSIDRHRELENELQNPQVQIRYAEVESRKTSRIAAIREQLPKIEKMLTERIAYLTDELDKGKSDRPWWMGWEM